MLLSMSVIIHLNVLSIHSTVLLMPLYLVTFAHTSVCVCVCVCVPGNIGSHLEDDLSRLRVYLSRDGGFFWQEIESGHWSFQMVALGSIIVMVPKRPTVDPVDYLLYVRIHTPYILGIYSMRSR